MSPCPPFPHRSEWRTPDGEWTRWSGTFFVPKTTIAWQFCLVVNHTLGRIWLDDVRFEKLERVDRITPDVWTYFPVGVPIGMPAP